MPAFLESKLPFPCRRGKVRDVYDLGETLLIVATDRISAFDVIMPNGIPEKGRILTALSLYWFQFFAKVPNHLIATELSDYPAALRPYAEQLKRRSMLVKKASVIPIECVARGYLAGSGWKEYEKSRTAGGIRLPAGLQQCSRLPTPLFTPATKAEQGHDMNITFEEMVGIVGKETAEELKRRTLALYTQAAEHAEKRGILIADTKFEFGRLPDGSIIVIDEMLTPDSSRFWPANEYEPGHDQSSFDKQFVRNWLESQPWNKTAPAPRQPDEIVVGTRQRYLEAFERLTGRRLREHDSV
jgi:phosphoribosylaminoimidazole-succinocarboxamide synthase